MFLGISLVSQNYINPAVDIIKTKGVFSADSMNATVLAFTNTAAESMIIMNAIFFGVSDMGIATTVSQTAFYVLIIQGYFYLIIEPGSRIDWWIITRDTVFLLVYLITFSVFLIGNLLEMWKAIILLILYFVHIILMKFNKNYEVVIKKKIHRTGEIHALNSIAKKDITKFHKNPNLRYRPEDLAPVEFEIYEGYVFIDSQYKRRIKDKYLRQIEQMEHDHDPNNPQKRRSFKYYGYQIVLRLLATKLK